MNESTANLIFLDHAVISPGENARKYFDPIALAGLKASIREHGVRQNISVMPHPEVEGHYILCAGERRWRATGDLLADLEKEGDTELAAKRREIKAEVLSAEDGARAFELGLVENLQRENITPLEEADAFFAMEHRINPDTGERYTHAEIARKMGKLTSTQDPDTSYVSKRLKLRNAPDFLLQAVNEKTVAPSVAELVGRVPDAKVRDELAMRVLKPKESETPLTYVATRALIQQEYMRSLRGCGFDPEEPDLVPVVKDDEGERQRGGACTDCPFRSGMNKEIQAELASGNSEGKRGGVKAGVAPDLCTNPSCFREKQDAVWLMIRRAAESKGQKCVDGDAARRIFSGYEGALAHDCAYARPEDKPAGSLSGWDPSCPPWKDLLKGTGLKLVVARNPHTNQQELLVPVKEAVEAVKAKAKQDGKKCVFNKAETSKRDPAKQKAEEEKRLREEAIKDKATSMMFEAFADRLKVAKPGDAAVGVILTDMLVQDFSDTDWPHVLAKFVGIEKEGYVPSAEVEKAVLKHYEASRKGNPNAWHQWLGLFVVARAFESVKWNQRAKDDPLLQRLAKQLGVDLPKCEKDAAAALSAPEKPAPEPGKKQSVPKTAVKAAKPGAKKGKGKAKK